MLTTRPLSSTGSIAFNFDPPYPPSAFDNGDLTGTTLFGFTDPTDFALSSNCHYSLRVMGGNQQGDNCQINIASAKAQPNVLWPPNHRMVPVTVTASASDRCDPNPVCKIIWVSSNEPVSGTGDGDTAPDWQITGNLAVDLRAERAGNGNGRVYTLTVQCTDQVGNSATQNTTVTIPHDHGGGHNYGGR